MTTTVAPDFIRQSNTPSSTLTSRGCKPIVGSSNTKTASSCVLPISVASFSLCASPPDSDGVLSPIVRYPSPNRTSVSAFSRILLLSRNSSAASLAVALMTSAIEYGLPPSSILTSSARGEKRLPPQSGQVISTSGKN